MDKVSRFYEIIEDNEMTAEAVSNLFLNYHGTKLLTDKFMDFVDSEGFSIRNP